MDTSCWKVQDYEDIVNRPGKFEGEPRYVPYYWWMDGGWDYMLGQYTFCYRIAPEDKKLFPELKQRKVIKLRETNDGFVLEV